MTAEALAPAASSTRNATNQAGFEIEAVSKATSLSAQPIRHIKNRRTLALATNCSVVAKSTERMRRFFRRIAVVGQ